MSDPIIFTALQLTGRLAAPDPSLPRLSATYPADFSADADVTLEFTGINQQGKFGVPRSLFVDNGSNPSEIVVTVQGTQDRFTIPAFAEGYFHVECAENSSIRFVTVGGATEQCTIIIYNWEVPPSVWYRFGAFNFDHPLMVEGTQPTGTDMDDPTTYNRPLLMAGVTAAGVLTRLLTDAAGAIVSGGGSVFGPDVVGNAPTHPPIFNGVLDSAGHVIGLQLNVVGGLPITQTGVTYVDYSIASMSGASQSVVVAGNGKNSIVLQCPSTNVGTVWLNLAGGAAVVGTGIPILPGGTYFIQPGMLNLLTGIAATATDKLIVYAG